MSETVATLGRSEPEDNNEDPMITCWDCQGVGTTNQLDNSPCPFCNGAGILEAIQSDSQLWCIPPEAIEELLADEKGRQSHA